MTTRNSSMLIRADFEQLLDVYGADRTRWPLGARAGAAALLASDAEARLLLAEAVALDAVLAKGASQAHGDTASMDALAARIMTAAIGTPRVVAVAPAPLAGWEIARPMARRLEPGSWRGAAMLAASLMIGIFVGQSQLGAHTLPKLAAMAGLSLGSAERIALADIELESTEID